MQDLERAFEPGKRTVGEDTQLPDRIDFMTHDFHHVQPVKNADAYLNCQCIANWLDRDLISIFEKLIPALELSCSAADLRSEVAEPWGGSDVDVLEASKGGHDCLSEYSWQVSGVGGDVEIA